MSIEQDTRGVSRREFLRTSAGAVAAGGVTAAAGTGAAQSGQPFGGYLSNTSNFDGTVVDERGTSEVTIEVGASGNNGDFAFAPPAVRVDPGTTIVWEWTGEGGQHNVVHEGGTFESKLTAEAGHTFSQSFQETGVVKYYCDPHEMLGMKGVVVVGGVQVGGGSGSGGGGDGGAGADGGDTGETGGGHGGGETGTAEKSAGDQTAATTLLAMLGLGFLSPVIFALVLKWQRPKGPVE